MFRFTAHAWMDGWKHGEAQRKVRKLHLPPVDSEQQQLAAARKKTAERRFREKAEPK